MAVTINADNGAVSGSAGLKQSADSTGVLALQTNGTTAVSISTGQVVTLTNALAEASGGTGTTIGYNGFKNRLINSAMVIDQRNAGASVSGTTGVYTLDRWNVQNNSGAARFNVRQNVNSVTPPAGFTYYLGITSTAAYSVAATDVIGINQFIEGYNIADLAWGTASAATVTLSFWVRSSLTGAFGALVVEAAAGGAYYSFSYTISAANTWEQKTVTIPGPTIGTWNSTNGKGPQVLFNMGVGSTYTGTGGSWTTSAVYSPTGSTNLVATNGATWYVTGVQLEKGSTATSFDYRPYGTELALCQRYYYKYSVTSSDQSFGSGYNYGTTNFVFNTKFPVSMRTAPSALEQTGTAGDYKVIYLSSTATCTSVPTFSSASVNAADSFWTVAAVLTAGQGALPRSSNANAFHAWSAEL